MSETQFSVCTPKETSWCPGCGDFGILASVKDALESLGKRPQDVIMMAGIGQAAKLPHYIKANGYCGLHGRSLPAAVGVKLSNHDLTVVINSGDGDIFGEGGNHFIHTVRRDIDITLILHNNQIYGLTQGQSSPLSDLGDPTKLQPRGVISNPLRGPVLALSLGARFVARSFSGDQKHLSETIQKAINHKGFSFVEVLQPCISMNKINTFGWYKSRINNINEDPHYDTKDRMKAIEKAFGWGDNIPTGIFLDIDEGESFGDRVVQLKKRALVKQSPLERAVLESVFKEHM
ncbi:MAG: 2-oxoacid:ferredoxin oxidoreductase subunit beta [Deltaproteobacteria bacterium]|nr:2-oxoacid:ferredoxin oxidoreductase subunit beta [Deltaproteobacteria bacterium]